jgi:hypothetical protein
MGILIYVSNSFRIDTTLQAGRLEGCGFDSRYYLVFSSVDLMLSESVITAWRVLELRME